MKFWNKMVCEHSYIEVCCWHLDGDMGIEAWDGAYTEFCTKCKTFKHGEIESDGLLFEGSTFGHGVPTREPHKWMTYKHFRWKWRNYEKLAAFQISCEAKGHLVEVNWGSADGHNPRVWVQKRGADRRFYTTLNWHQPDKNVDRALEYLTGDLVKRKFVHA